MPNKILANKPLLILAAAEAISTLGNWITMMAVFSLLVFRGDGGVAESSGVFLAGLLPVLIFGPLGGKLCDKYNQTHMMLAANLLAGAAVSLLIMVNSLPLVYLCIVLESVFLAVITPGRQSLLPHIVDGEDLTKANALLQQISSLVKVFGPMIGAAIVGAIGPRAAVILDVLSFAVAAGLISLLSRRLIRSQVEDNDTLPEVKHDQTAAGKQKVWPFLRQSAPLKLLFAAGFFAMITIMGLDVLSSVYTRDILRAGERFYGMYLGGVGLGSAASGIYLLVRKGSARPFRDLGTGLMCLAALVLSLGLSAYVSSGMARTIAIVASLVGGWGNGVVLVQSTTVLQTVSPTKILGRIAGLFQAVIVAGQLISLAITPMIVPRFLSVGPFFLVSGVALLLLALTTIFVAERRKQQAPVHGSQSVRPLAKGEM